MMSIRHCSTIKLNPIHSAIDWPLERLRYLCETHITEQLKGVVHEEIYWG
jgi:hypothetical protein